MKKTFKKVVLVEYNNCGPQIHIMTSTRPIRGKMGMDRIHRYFVKMDGFDEERDGLTIIGDLSEITTINLDKRLNPQ